MLFTEVVGFSTLILHSYRNSLHEILGNAGLLGGCNFHPSVNQPELGPTGRALPGVCLGAAQPGRLMATRLVLAAATGDGTGLLEKRFRLGGVWMMLQALTLEPIQLCLVKRSSVLSSSPHLAQLLPPLLSTNSHALQRYGAPIR